MIVRDEEKTLKRCLDSVRSFVDEIIIVDTGSIDQTREIAGRFTDHVFYFPWRDDFSAARNEAFSKAAMDYCMWLDADDIVPPEEAEKISAWKKSTDGSVDVLMLKYATAFDENGKISFSFYRERILKRACGFQWKGRVHEVIQPMGKIEYADISIEHHSIKKIYSMRNLFIYELMLQNGELTSPRDYFYYARELYYHGHYEEAVKYLRKFLKMPDAYIENLIEGSRIAAYCCYRLGREADALAFLLGALAFRTPDGELCCDIGKHFLDREKWKQAVFWYESALRTSPDEKIGGFVQSDCYGYLPCIQLSVCYYHLGELQRASEYHRQAGSIKNNGKEFLQNEKYFSSLEI